MARKSKARLMKGEQMKLTSGEKLVLFYRENPVQACEDLLGFKLMWLQRIILRELWFKRFTMLCLSRGLGKSFVFTVFAILKAMLYPDTNIGIITPAYRQVKLFIFPEIRKWYSRCPYFKNTVEGRIKTATEGCLVSFRNGSFIEGLPPGHDGANIRGRRYHVVLADEFAHMDETIIKEVIRPMLNIMVHGRSNQYHIASTPYYKWTHMWPAYLHQIRMCKKKPADYGLVEFDYKDVNNTPTTKTLPRLPYIVDENIIEMQKADMTSEQFEMENLARFPDETSAYFSSKLLDYASPRKPPGPVKIEYEGDKHGRYAMGVDVARKFDNFSISVGRELDGRTKLVRVMTLNNMTYQEMHALVRDTLERFPIEGVVIGEGGGGLTLKDMLAQDYISPKDGKPRGRILDPEDPVHQEMEGQNLVLMVNETGPLNQYMYANIKAAMESKRFIFPPPVLYSEDTENIKDKLAMKEIIQTQQEFLKLQATPASYGYKYTVPDPKKDRKDRATSTTLMYYWFSEKYKEFTKPKVELGTGFWIPTITEGI